MIKDHCAAFPSRTPLSNSAKSPVPRTLCGRRTLICGVAWGRHCYLKCFEGSDDGLLCLISPHSNVLNACARREEWNEWGPQPDETTADYELRVKDTFHFRRKEVPPHLINTVTVPGMYGSQRTGAVCFLHRALSFWMHGL